MIPELRLLGGAALSDAEGRLISGAAAQPRRMAVLAVLAEAWPSAVTRDRLIGLIWPDHDEAGARRLLTQALYALRRELGDFTASAGRDVSIDVEALRVDLVDFRRALAAGDLESAAALYRGPLLDGFHLGGSLEFERWAATLRDDLRRRFLGAVEELVRRDTAQGRLRDAARWAERRVQEAPFDVDAVLGAIELWEQVGDHGAALAAASAYERRMRQELEVEPDPAVRRRVDAIRSSATRRASPAAAFPAVSSSVPRAAVAEPDEPVEAAAIAASLASTTPHEVGRGSLRWRRVRWALVGLALTAGAFDAVARLRARSAPPPSRTVAVLPFEVRGDTAAAGLATTLASVLTSNLDGSDGVLVERAAADSQPLSAALLSVGRARQQPWAVLTGVVIATGAQLRLDAELRPTAGDARPIRVSVTGSRDSLIALAERLSLQLVPAFYPELREVLDQQPLSRFARIAALRRQLDGETALRRGAFDSAFAAFRTATELDSAQAYAWYRRAVAAELSHRSAEADRSIAAARALDGTLSVRERLLVGGYAAWRAGDARAAETILRGLVKADSRNREAWFHLAEIAYHRGPLDGRAIDAARDPWRQVVALDSGNVPALVHAVRLEARAGDTASLAALMRRLGASHPDGTAAAEARVIAAFGVGDPRAVERTLDSLPDYSLHFLQGVVAGFLERPAEARGIARRMTAVPRPDAVRADGHVALAHLALARGRWREAWTELDRATMLNPVDAAWSRAYFASITALPLPAAARRTAARALASAPSAATAAPLYLQLAVDASAAAVIQRYLADVLRVGDDAQPMAPASLACERAELDTPTYELCVDLRRGILADSLRRAGRFDAALRTLEAVEMRVPYQFAGRSLFFARTRERFLRAELLERLGRDDEAYAWYGAVPFGSRFDFVFLAPSHLRRGRIRERQGDRAAAARHYAAAVALWRDADAELEPLRREAEDGLRRVRAPR